MGVLKNLPVKVKHVMLFIVVVMKIPFALRHHYLQKINRCDRSYTIVPQPSHSDFVQFEER